MSPGATTRHPLERLLMPLEPLGVADPAHGGAQTGAEPRVRCASATGPAGWLGAGDWRLYVAAEMSSPRAGTETIERFVAEDGAIAEAVRTDPGDVLVPFSLAEAYDNYTRERWIAAARPRRVPPAALDLFYKVKRAIPRTVQLAARRAVIRWQGLPSFPTWPYDESVAALLRFTIRCALIARASESLPFRWFWPHGASAAAILTHDVESAAGLRNAVRVADLEQGRGLRSSFNLVASWYPIDWGIVDELRGRGFELGLHGIYHDRSLFSSRPAFERQLPLLRESAGRLGAHGFRSPATHRVPDWIAELPVAYDCTVPLSDPYEPQPGGCCSPWPYFFGDVVELPYTLPQDHTLYTLLSHRSIDLWTAQVRRLERSHGLIQCLSHPDPGYLGDPENRDRYAELLDYLVGRESLWLTLPREVAGWWVARDAATSRPDSDELGIARLDDSGEVVLIAPRGGPPE